jgi:hypothetical protein
MFGGILQRVPVTENATANLIASIIDGGTEEFLTEKSEDC